MDALLDEMPADQYLEWLEFDSLEPLNPAGKIVDGLFEKKAPGAKNWMAQKAKMLTHIAHFGKKK